MKNYRLSKLSTITLCLISILALNSCSEEESSADLKETKEESSTDLKETKEEIAKTDAFEELDNKFLTTYSGKIKGLEKKEKKEIDFTTGKVVSEDEMVFDFTRGTIATLEKTSDKTYQISFVGYGGEDASKFTPVTGIKFTTNVEKNEFNYTNGNTTVILKNNGNLIVEQIAPKKIKFVSFTPPVDTKSKDRKDCSACVITDANLGKYGAKNVIYKSELTSGTKSPSFSAILEKTSTETYKITFNDPDSKISPITGIKFKAEVSDQGEKFLYVSGSVRIKLTRSPEKKSGKVFTLMSIYNLTDDIILFEASITK